MNGSQHRLAIHQEHNRRRSADENYGWLGLCGDGLYRHVYLLQAGDHAVKADRERHGRINLMGALLHYCFLRRIKRGKTRAENLDIPDENGARAHVCDGIRPPRNNAQDCLAVVLRDGDRSVSYQAAVVAPALKLVAGTTTMCAPSLSTDLPRRNVRRCAAATAGVVENGTVPSRRHTMMMLTRQNFNFCDKFALIQDLCCPFDSRLNFRAVRLRAKTFARSPDN